MKEWDILGGQNILWPFYIHVALIIAADGVCQPTSAALIIGRQGRRSIYPDRPVRPLILSPPILVRADLLVRAGVRGAAAARTARTARTAHFLVSPQKTASVITVGDDPRGGGHST